MVHRTSALSASFRDSRPDVDVLDVAADNTLSRWWSLSAAAEREFVVLAMKELTVMLLVAFSTKVLCLAPLAWPHHLVETGGAPFGRQNTPWTGLLR